MFAIVSLVVAGLLAVIVVLIIRGRRVSAPTAETPQIVYFENKRDSFLDWLYHRTSSPEVPVQVKLRDWVAQQLTYYLVQGGYVYAYDTEGNPLDAGRALRDRPDAFQLTPSEYQRRVTQLRQ